MSKRLSAKKLHEKKDELIIVHYSCSSTQDKYPSISSISVYDTKQKLPNTFSRDNLSKEDEISMLEQFFKYVSKKIKYGYSLLGWNWGDKYGIDSLITRYKFLTKNKSPINTSRITFFDFLKIVSTEYNEFFGGFKVLAKFNGLDLVSFIDGVKELELFKNQSFRELNSSTSKKVEVMYHLLLRYLNNDIQVPSMEEIFYSYKDLGSYPVFKDNILKIQRLIEVKNVDVHDSELQGFLRRLLFANVITTMETYLSDTFIRLVINDPKSLKKYIEKSKKFKEEISKKKIYSGIFDEMNGSSNLTLERFLVKTVIEDIRTISFHNLDKQAKPYYKDVLGITFPDGLGEIYKAVELRHHLIHRNGKDKNDRLIKIEYNDLRKLIREVKRFVDDIHKKTKKLTK